MAANVRTPEQRERDQERIAEWWCQGKTHRWMAERIGVSRPEITMEISAMRAEWAASKLGQVNERTLSELAKIDHLESVAWTAFEKSCEDATYSEITRGRTNKDGDLLPDQLKTGRKGQAGDPRFLERVAWCIEQRLRVIGGYAQPNQSQPGVSVTVVAGIDLAAVVGAKPGLTYEHLRNGHNSSSNGVN